MYIFVDANELYGRRLSDDAVIPWDAEAGGPLGGGEVWRQWEADGRPQPAPYEPPPPALDDYRRAIQSHIDATAQARNYDSGATCAGYVNSTNSAWAAEATAFVAWRDAAWAYAYAELAKVQDGARPQPTVAEIVGELPAIDWPE